MKERYFDLQLFAEEEQQEESQETEGATQEEGQTSEALTKDDIEKMIQSGSDKIRQEVHKQYKDQLKQLEQENESIKKEKMTAEEKAQYEAEQRQKELEAKDKEIKQRELRLKSYDVMKENEVPQEFQDLLLAGVEDDDSLAERAKVVGQTVKTIKNNIREEIYKEFGREPHQTEGAKGFSKEQLDKMSPEEINKNWDVISQQMEEGKI